MTTPTKWGLYDTDDNCWMGNAGGTGPLLYDDADLKFAKTGAEIIAKIAAQMMDVALRQEPGRTRARVFNEGPLVVKDEKTMTMTPLEALQRMERGGF